MATAALPQLHTALTAQHLTMINGSTTSSGTTPSPICSTPVTVLNPGYQQFIQYVQPPNQYTPTTIQPIIPPVTQNAFEGVPIFLVPQSASGTSPIVSFAALQKAAVSYFFFLDCRFEPSLYITF